MFAGNRLFALFILLAGCWLACASLRAGEIRVINVQAGPTGTRAEIHLADGAGDYRLMTLTGPDRLVVDFPGSHLADNLSLPAAIGVVSAVRTGQPAPGILRVVFDLSEPVVALRPQMHSPGSGDGVARLLIEWPGDDLPEPALQTAALAFPAPDPSAPDNADQETARALALLGASTPVAAAAPVAAVTSPPSASTPTPVHAVTAPVSRQPDTRPLIIAIDAGHGGKDPGAINRSTGTREKDVALAIARELARQVDATPGLRAYLTRNSDVFIELPERSRMARAAHADMFISIHANASKNNLAARGASVHLLSTRGASSQYARWLADEENAADLIGSPRPHGNDTVTNVLLSLAQSGTMKAAQDAGNHVLDELRQIGRIHSPTLEYANLSVLRNADMPAMLVETGFLSNREDERLLVNPAYQRRVAGAVLQGVITFFSRQPPPDTLFAARAQAEMMAMAGGGR